MLTIKNFCCLQCVILFHFVLTVAVKWLNFLSVRRKSHHPNEALFKFIQGSYSSSGPYCAAASLRWLNGQSEWIGQLSGLWVCWLVELSVGQQGGQLTSPSWWAGRTIEWVSYLVQWSVWMNRFVERSVSHQLIGCTINLFVSQLSCTAVEDKFIKFEFLSYQKVLKNLL